MSATRTLPAGYRVSTPATLSLRSGYRIATSGDLGLSRFVEGEDPWADGMNQNLDRIDATLFENASTASSTAARAAQVQATVSVGGVNLLVNPDFSVWQRGTSFSGSSGFYTADQWKAEGDGSATILRGTGLGLSEASARITFSLGVGSLSRYLRQRIERPKNYRGRNLTLAADCELVSGSGGSYRIAIVDDSGTTSSSSGTGSERLLVSKTISASATFIEVRLYFEATNASGVVSYEGAFGSVSLVPSLVTSLPFLPRHPSDEMVLCQRYYQTYSHPSYAFFRQNSSGLNGVSYRIPMTFPPMVSVPTVTFSSTNTTPGSVTFSASSTSRSSFDFLVSGLAGSVDCSISQVTLTLEAALF